MGSNERKVTLSPGSWLSLFPEEIVVHLLTFYHRARSSDSILFLSPFVEFPNKKNLDFVRPQSMSCCAHGVGGAVDSD